MHHMTRISTLAAFVVAAVLCLPARGQTDIKKFPLAQAVPADVFITVAARANPDRAWLDEYWAEVLAAFHNSGILEDIGDLIIDSVGDEQLDEVEEIRDRFGELCGKIDWDALFEKEMVYAGRFSWPMQPGSLSPYQGIFLGRSSSEKTEANYNAIREAFKEVADLIAPESGEAPFSVTEAEIGGVTFALLGTQDAPDIFAVGRHKDVLILSITGKSLLEESLARLKGEAKTLGVVETERFKQAFGDLPAADDTIVYFDIGNLFDRMGSMVKTITGAQMPPGDGGAPPAENNPINKLVGDISMFDYIAEVERTDGYRVLADSVTRLKPGATDMPLGKVLSSNKPLDKFEKYIPEDATEFWCTSGIDFHRLYTYVLDVVKLSGDGKRIIADFEEIQKEQWKLNLEDDVIKLIDGQMISIGMGREFVLMLKTADQEKAAEQFGALVAFLRKQGQEGGLMITEVDVAGRKGFMQFNHPLMMMMGGGMAPVSGFADGYFMLGSSPRALALCIQTSEGKHPNITKSARWNKEALSPRGRPVDSISFTDETKFAQELQEAIAGLSMGLGMAPMFMGEAPPEVTKKITAIAPMITKLAPVAAKLNFYQSSADYTTFDGKQWYTRKVQNYKDPSTLKKEKPKSAATSASAM